jgi:hypothetical protein
MHHWCNTSGGTSEESARPRVHRCLRGVIRVCSAPGARTRPPSKPDVVRCPPRSYKYMS